MAILLKNKTHPASRRSQRIWLSGLLLSMVLLGAGCNAHVKPTTTGESTTDQESPIHQPNVIEASPAWFSCKADADCAVTEGVCGSSQAVNRNYLQPFFSYRDRMNQMVDCTNNKTKETGNHTAQCLKHRCSLNPPDHQPNLDPA